MILELPDDFLRDLIRKTVAEVLDQRAEHEATLGNRLGYPEAEAAALLTVPRHVLRDARLRGEVSARKVGRGFRYSRTALLDYLAGGDGNGHAGGGGGR